MKNLKFLIILFFISLLGLCYCNQEEASDVSVFQGRTLVHHAVKRFMVIAPAIFFKLGIAFTLLLITSVVSINNGFIGFLLVMMGLSNILANLQARRPPVSTNLLPLPYQQYG